MRWKNSIGKNVYSMRNTPKTYYAIGYRHTLYNDTQPTIQYATYFQLESAQEAMMKMIKRGQDVLGMEEKKLLSYPQILTIHRKGTPQCMTEEYLNKS